MIKRLSKCLFFFCLLGIAVGVGKLHAEMQDVDYHEDAIGIRGDFATEWDVTSKERANSERKGVMQILNLSSYNFTTKYFANKGRKVFTEAATLFAVSKGNQRGDLYVQINTGSGQRRYQKVEEDLDFPKAVGLKDKADVIAYDGSIYIAYVKTDKMIFRSARVRELRSNQKIDFRTRTLRGEYTNADSLKFLSTSKNPLLVFRRSNDELRAVSIDKDLRFTASPVIPGVKKLLATSENRRYPGRVVCITKDSNQYKLKVIAYTKNNQIKPLTIKNLGISNTVVSAAASTSRNGSYALCYNTVGDRLNFVSISDDDSLTEKEVSTGVSQVHGMNLNNSGFAMIFGTKATNRITKYFSFRKPYDDSSTIQEAGVSKGAFGGVSFQSGDWVFPNTLVGLDDQTIVRVFFPSSDGENSLFLEEQEFSAFGPISNPVEIEDGQEIYSKKWARIAQRYKLIGASQTIQGSLAPSRSASTAYIESFFDGKQVIQVLRFKMKRQVNNLSAWKLMQD